jgi:hypothetical protein
VKLYLNFAQGSEDWYRARLGIPTASSFDQIVTPKKCEPSKSAAKYALKLAAERLLNMPTDSIEGQAWMERGKELEPDAVLQYEFVNEVKTVPVGFITNDEGTIGCSPDRIVLNDRRVGLEIKCPAPHVHLGYLLAHLADEYRPQVQGQILVAELDHADLYSYHPRMPAATIRSERENDYIAKLSEGLKEFLHLLDDVTERARKLGAYQALTRPASPPEVYEAQVIHRTLEGDAITMFANKGFEA